MFFVVLQVAGWITALGWAARATYLKGSRSFRTDFGLQWERFDIFRGIVTGFGTLILIAIVVAALGANVGDPTISELEPDGAFQVLLFGFALVVGAPIVEEIFFRGLFLRAAERRFGTFGAVVFVTTVFTVLHVPQRMELGFVLAFVPIFTIGLLFALLAVRYRRLGPGIAAHMTFNGIAFLALIASQNGAT
ncbi:MAG: type II CAAX endopeptidase family protein [Actinomycetota bacterium]